MRNWEKPCLIHQLTWRMIINSKAAAAATTKQILNMLFTTGHYFPNSILIKRGGVSTATSATLPLSQAVCVSLSSPKLYSPSLVPSPFAPHSPRPLGCWIMHTLWRIWQAEPQLQTISIQAVCCLWEEGKGDLHTISLATWQTDPKKKKNDLSLAFQQCFTYNLSLLSRNFRPFFMSA